MQNTAAKSYQPAVRDAPCSEAGIAFVEISEVTGNPEAFGGRMKTISFNIESALLYDREKDATEAANLGIKPIDMVVCNLYPFAKVLQSGAEFDVLVENIDIGGPTMIRAAAKNHKYVSVLTSPDDYKAVQNEMDENEGKVSATTRFHLMRKAFNHTADYDALIADAMNKYANEPSLRLTFDKRETLRYGENSHQTAARYRFAGAAAGSLNDMKVLHGKALSYNNILDIAAAIDAVRPMEGTACSVVKHTNPCGLAEGKGQRRVFELAWQGDPISAFGSIIAFNRPLELETAKFLRLDAENRMERKFVEVVIAPAFLPEALEYLKIHKNLRIIEYNVNAAKPNGVDYRFVNGILLEQSRDNDLYNKMEVSTQHQPDMEVLSPLVTFGLKVISQIKSNTIAVVRETDGGCYQLLGMGAGQPNRLVATRLAMEKCAENLTNEFNGHINDVEAYIHQQIGETVMISDAFFPFEDNVELAATYGIKTIVQPGGSIRDKHVIAKCNELGIAMIMTGLRHFKH